jgi:hypothetical protein
MLAKGYVSAKSGCSTAADWPPPCGRDLAASSRLRCNPIWQKPGLYQALGLAFPNKLV